MNQETPKIHNEQPLPYREIPEGRVWQGMNSDRFREHLVEQGFEDMGDAFEKMLLVVQALQKKGGRALLVGGAVRDELLGAPIKDFDLEVYGLSPDRKST